MKYIDKITINEQDYQVIPVQSSGETVGGIKAVQKTNETVPVATDSEGNAFVPPYPTFDDKVNINQGVDNKGKILAVNSEGDAVVMDYKSGSDNYSIGIVEKSENPSVDDAYEHELMDLKMYGKSTQETTTGVNLFDRTSLETLGGTAVVPKSTSISLKPNTQYTFSDNYGKWNGDGLYMYVTNTPDELNDQNKIAIIINSNLADRNSFTFQTNDSQDFYVTTYATNIIKILQNASEIQINEGSTALPYEPYTGGKPSPSPEYKQEITKIDKIDCKVVGQNLFNKNMDGLNQGAMPSTWSDIGVDFVFSVGTYYAKDDLGSVRYDKYLINGQVEMQINGSNGIVFDENTEKIRIYIFRTVSGQTFEQHYETFRIGVSLMSIASYTPFVGSQQISITPPHPLYSTPDGSVCDEVDVVNGVYRYWLSGEVVFDGSDDEKWKQGTADGQFFIDVPNAIQSTTNIFCNRFIPNPSNVIGTCRFGGSFNVVVDNTIATTVEELKTWLSSNPVVLVCGMKTQTEIPIPENDLKQLRSLTTFTGTTNVICNAPVSFEYQQSLQLMIDKILQQIQATNAKILL